MEKIKSIDDSIEGGGGLAPLWEISPIEKDFEHKKMNACLH